MSILSNIFGKIFRKKPAHAREPEPATGGAAVPHSTAAAPAPQAATEPVDVEQVLEELAAQKGGGGNWRTSIVDLLKLLDLDSSLAARQELAEELNVNAGPHGSAEQNVALIKAVWRALERNGGKVPASLRD